MKTLVVLAFAVALGAGVLLFPNALEPGEAERDGMALDLVQPGTDRLASEDWYLGSSAVRISGVSAGAKVIVDPRTRIALTSRSLAVLPGECYRLSFTGRSSGSRMQVQVMDEDLRTQLRTVPVPRREAATRAFSSFTPGDRRRISLLLRTHGAATAIIGDVRLDRVPTGDCPGTG
jgi:hypothetical protein